MRKITGRLFRFAGPVRRILGFPMSLQMLARDCASPRVLRGVVDTTGEAKGVDEEIYEGCNAMIRHFQQLCQQKMVNSVVHFPGFSFGCLALLAGRTCSVRCSLWGAYAL